MSFDAWYVNVDFDNGDRNQILKFRKNQKLKTILQNINNTHFPKASYGTQHTNMLMWYDCH